jgi:uncharacterized membrane protein
MSELFTTATGLLSLFTIVFVLVIGAFFISFFRDNIIADEKRAERRADKKAKAAAAAQKS